MGDVQSFVAADVLWVNRAELTRELDREAAQNLVAVAHFGLPGILTAVAWLWPDVDHRALIASIVVGTIGTVCNWFGSRRFLRDDSTRSLTVSRVGTFLTSSACGFYSLFGMPTNPTDRVAQTKVVLVSVTILATAASANSASRILMILFSGPLSFSLTVGMIRAGLDPALFLGILIFILISDRAYRTARVNTRRVFTEKARADQLAGQLAEALARSEIELLHDPLTGAGNRRMLGRLYDLTSPVDACSVICIDLDHFKALNDRHGHSVGDELLVAVTSRIQSTLRSNDQLVRLGGDEFMVVVQADLHTAHGIAERILHQLGTYTLSVGDVTIGASIGVAALDPGRSLETAQRRADQAMYRAKSHGRNQVAVWTEADTAATQAPTRTSQDVRANNSYAR